MMMFGRKLLTALKYLQPSDSQIAKKKGKDEWRIRKKQIVYAKNFVGDPEWMKGTIIKQVGRRSWLVSTNRGVVRRHKNDIRTTSQQATDGNASSAESPERPCRSSLLPFSSQTARPIISKTRQVRALQSVVPRQRHSHSMTLRKHCHSDLQDVTIARFL
ncbi:hypothetical protein MRX96_034592 [Rhipicephalus microplus]